MSNKVELLNAIRSIQEEYRENTYDFLEKEAYCQEKLLNALRKEIKGYVFKEVDAIPKMIARGSRVRKEITKRLGEGEENRHDICIFREGSIDVTETNTVETIIEIKHGYHYSAGQVTNKQAIGKDFKILSHYYKSSEGVEAFLIYFMGNNFEIQREQHPSQIIKYKEGLGEGLKNEGMSIEAINDICKNNILMVFLDKVVDGNMQEVNLQDKELLKISTISFGHMIHRNNYKEELIPLLNKWKEEDKLFNNEGTANGTITILLKSYDDMVGLKEVNQIINYITDELDENCAWGNDFEEVPELKGFINISFIKL